FGQRMCRGPVFSFAASRVLGLPAPELRAALARGLLCAVQGALPRETGCALGGGSERSERLFAAAEPLTEDAE
ncbi:unnamed protein product, partial [Polarella glacialis]